MPSLRGLIDKYVTHHTKPEVAPPITTTTAALLLSAYTVAYVAPLYLSSRTRPSAQLPRDAPSCIRARIASVMVSCICCSAATFWLLTRDGTVSSQGALHLMGYWPVGLAETARALLLTAVLFAGPLFEHLVVEGGWRAWLTLGPLRGAFTEWTTYRNIVAGPVTEEVLFRSAGIPLMLLARTSVAKTVFVSPVIFGLAHLHHFYEFRLTHPRVPLAAAAARSLFQLAFTVIFGAYATFLFLRGGSLLSICLVHALCNSLGLPRVWGPVRPVSGPALHLRPASADGGDANKVPGTLLWTVAYYLILVSGAVGFYRNLWTLTKSPLELIPMA